MLRLPRLFESLLALASVIGAEAQTQTAAKPTDPASSPAKFVLSSQRDPITSLRTYFRFQPGDGPRWAAPDFDDSKWKLVRSNLDWDHIGYRGLSGLAWYRFEVILPAGEEAYALYLPQINTDYQVFADGQLLLTAGKMPPHARTYRTRATLVELPRSKRLVPTAAHLAIRVWQDPAWVTYNPGGPQGSIKIGRADLLRTQFINFEDAQLWSLTDWFELGALDLLAALVALALFLVRRSEREYLWFSLLALGSAAHHLLEAWAFIKTSPLHLTETMENLCFAVYLVASLFFYRSLLSARWTRSLKLAVISSGLWLANTSMLGVWPWFTAWKENAGELIFILPVYAWILGLVYKRARERHPDGRLLVLPVSLLLGTWVLYQLLFTLQTFGYEWARRWSFNLWIQRPIYANLQDVAEGIFLLAMLAILVNRFTRTRREQDRVASELEAARLVQQVLVPESMPELSGLQILTAYHPAQEVGGDFFQMMTLNSGDVVAVVGDVAGKGMPAALTVSLVIGTLRTLADYTDSPAEILSSLNRRLHGRGPGFTTCLVLRLSANRSGLTLANAGHLPPYLNGKELETENNLPLGFDPLEVYVESRFALVAGDRLTLLTDGVPEATRGRELFGFERTLSLSQESASSIAEAARTFGQTDDITVLTIDIVTPSDQANVRLISAMLPA